MANLYNGFNALALGQAINNTHNGIANRNITGLQVLGDSLSDFFKAEEEAQKEADRKKSALDYLMGNGYDQQKAEQFVNAVDPSEAVRYLQGRLDKQADTEDEREYQELDYLNKRADMLADKRKDKIDDWNDWVSKNNITYGQAAKQAQFGQLMQQLGLISAKDWGNSRQGVDQYNDTINALKQFAEKNNEYMDVLGLINTSFGNAGNNGFYDEDIKEMLRKLGGKDTTDQQREDYLKELIKNDKFSYILDNPKFSDAILTFGANVDKKNLMKQVNLQRLLGNTVTETQRGKQRQNADWVNRKKNLANMISEAYNDRTHSKAFPNLNENELAAMKEIFKKNPWVLNHYLKK